MNETFNLAIDNATSALYQGIVLMDPYEVMVIIMDDECKHFMHFNFITKV